MNTAQTLEKQSTLNMLRNLVQQLTRQRRQDDFLQRFTRRVHHYATVLMMMFAITLVACGGGADIPAPSTPFISVQPADTSVVVGNSATLSITVTGLNPAYQWQLSSDAGVTWGDITGATQASYTIVSVSNNDNGKRFRVKVTAAGMSVTSSAIQLTVTAAPVAAAITVQPTSQSVTAPATASFSVTATGTSLNYQWQSCADANAICATWTNLAGAAAASYNIVTTDVAMNGQRFQVVVSNTLGSVTSAVVMLNVAATPTAPIFTTQPVSATITSGQTTSFTVAVSGAPTPTLQWQLSADSGVTWSNIAGGNSSPLTIVGALSDSGRQYRVVATNSVSATISNVATLTVNPAPILPAFTTQPASVTITEGGNASFTVAVNGTPSPTLQWQLSTDSGVNWSNIVGQTGSVFNVVGAVLTNNGRQFRVVATNGAGTVNSNAATLTVNAAPPAGLPSFTTHPADVTVIAGQNASFTVAVSGTPTPTLQWQLRGNSLQSWGNLTDANGVYETNPTLNLAATTLAQNGFQLRVVATNSAGVTNSNVATLTVNPALLAAGWQGAALVQTNSTSNGDQPQIATDAAGNAIAVWRQDDGLVAGVKQFSIRAARYAASTGQWGAPLMIGGGYSMSPKVAMDANGNALVVWSEIGTGIGANGFVWAKQFVASTSTWSVAVALETQPTGAGAPEIAMNAATGNATVIWYVYAGSINGAGGVMSLKASSYTAGSGFGVASVIGTADTWCAFCNAPRLDSYRVVMDASDNATVVWYQSNANASADGIYANRYAAGAGWGGPSVIQSAATPQSVAMAANGNAAVVWNKTDANGVPGIWISWYSTTSGIWGTPSLKRAQAGIAVNQIVLDTAGYALMSWTLNGSPLVDRFLSTGTSTTTRLDGAASPAELSIDSTGNAVAVWGFAYNPNSTYNIRATRYLVGTGWSLPYATLQSSTPQNGILGVAEQKVAIAANGNIVAVWSQQTATQTTIWANVFK